MFISNGPLCKTAYYSYIEIVSPRVQRLLICKVLVWDCACHTISMVSTAALETLQYKILDQIVYREWDLQIKRLRWLTGFIAQDTEVHDWLSICISSACPVSTEHRYTLSTKTIGLLSGIPSFRLGDDTSVELFKISPTMHMLKDSKRELWRYLLLTFVGASDVLPKWVDDWLKKAN